MIYILLVLVRLPLDIFSCVCGLKCNASVLLQCLKDCNILECWKGYLCKLCEAVIGDDQLICSNRSFFSGKFVRVRVRVCIYFYFAGEPA
jgi:hypothetical protein